ncbi:MAG: hypothetical protein KAK00_05245 [Nanoarchaeota archaeon]|nr:hypothetical protein [Nanoarchaeota archaeon]
MLINKMEDVKSYLEFGYKKGEEKVIYDSKEEQDAYDFFMVPRYLKDIISYRTGKIENVHHKDDLTDNKKKYAALTTCKRFSENLVFYEVGSSLMGVIDSLEYINRQTGKLDIKKIQFIGVDNSKMMNHVAKYIHHGYDIKLYEGKTKIECDVFFAKGVSILYAFENEEIFCSTLLDSKISIFDYTFSTKDKLNEFVGTGKKVTFLSLDKCRELLDKEGKILILEPSQRIKNDDEKKVTYECIFGDKEIVSLYLEELKKS